MRPGGSTSTLDSVLIGYGAKTDGLAVRLFGVGAFLLGVLALGMLAVRRGQNIPSAWPDYVMMFVGIAGAITGLAVFFLRFN